jgi:hypothetical protein
LALDLFFFGTAIRVSSDRVGKLADGAGLVEGLGTG